MMMMMMMMVMIVITMFIMSIVMIVIVILTVIVTVTVMIHASSRSGGCESAHHGSKWTSLTGNSDLLCRGFEIGWQDLRSYRWELCAPEADLTGPMAKRGNAGQSVNQQLPKV
jgi:hypothetical protein